MDERLPFYAALNDIVKYGQKAIESTAALSYEKYLASWDEQLIVERCLSVVGEAASRVRKLGFASELPDTNKIIGFRNRLIHEYDAMTQSDIWGILRIHLPELVKRAQHILEQSGEKGDIAFIA